MRNGGHVTVRRLRWRVMRAGHWLDLVEERRAGETPVYVGLVDGRETLRSVDQRGLAGNLIRLALTRDR